MKYKDLLKFMFLGLGGGASFVKGIDWLFRDEFSTDDPAPITTGRTAEPGPGTLTVVDTDNKSSISSGALQLAPHSTPAHGDPGVWETDGLARVLGRVVIASLTLDQKNIYVGWDSNKAGTIGIAPLNFTSTATLRILGGSTVVGSYAAATSYNVAVVLRNAGHEIFIKGGIYTDWTSLWIANVDINTPLYAGITNYDATLSADYLRVADLPAPFNEDVLHLRDSVVAQSDTFTHPERCVIEFDLDTLPSANQINLWFRNSGSDEWNIYCHTDGSLQLRKNTVQQATSGAGVLTNGDRIAVVVDGDNISGYYNGTHAWTDTDATDFQTYTGGKLNNVGTGGAISDLDIYGLGPGIVTYEDATPETSDTFVHDADFELTFTVTTLATTATGIRHYFRIEDGTTYWEFRVLTTGAIKVLEYPGADNRINVASGVSDGDTVKCIAIGEHISVYKNDVWQASYSSASAAVTETAGKVQDLQNGVISNISATSLARHNPPGIATQSVLGFPVVGQVYEHPADFVMEFFLNTKPSAGNFDINFRSAVSGTTTWGLRLTTANINLLKTGAGVVAFENGNVADGQRYMLVCAGSVITVYRDNVQALTHTDAAHATNILGDIKTLGTDTIFSNFIIYPRTLSGTAKAVLDKHSA